MTNYLPIVQIVVAVVLMVLILLQQRGAALGSAFAAVLFAGAVFAGVVFAGAVFAGGVFAALFAPGLEVAQAARRRTSPQASRTNNDFLMVLPSGLIISRNPGRTGPGLSRYPVSANVSIRPIH